MDVAQQSYQLQCDAASNGDLKKLKGALGNCLDNPSYTAISAVRLEHEKAESSPLVLAALNNHGDVVQYLLEEVYGTFSIDKVATVALDVDTRKIHHCTALNAATIRGNLAIVSYLLKKGASHSIVDCVGATPLCEAVFHNRMDVAKSLIEHGADVNIPNAMCWTPLHVACQQSISSESVSLLLENGADFFRKTPEGHTPLHVAAFSGRLRNLKALLKHDENLKQHLFASPSDDTPCPLYLAASKGDMSIVKYLTNLSECSATCRYNAWVLVDALNTGRREKTLWKRALKLHGTKPLLLPPIELYEGRTEIATIEELDSLSNKTGLVYDIEFLYQSLIVMERCLGSSCHYLPFSLVNLASHIMVDFDDKDRHHKVELIFSKVVELVTMYKIPAAEKGYLLPQIFQLQVGEEIILPIILSMRQMINSDFTPNFEMYLQFAVHALDTVKTGAQAVAHTYGCRDTDLKYLIHHILNILRLWLNWGSKQHSESSSSMQRCSELGSQFVTDYLQLSVGDSPTLLDCALYSLDSILKSRLQAKNEQFIISECLLFDSLFQWGMASVINTQSQGDRPLHKLVTSPRIVKGALFPPLLTCFLSHGAHPDAVNAQGDTMLDLCDRIECAGDRTAATMAVLGLVTFPPPLTCITACKILEDGLSYSVLPNRLRTFIKLHDHSL